MNDANIGHNQPPANEVLKDVLASKHPKLLNRRDEFLSKSTNIPAVIDDDETSGKAQEFVKAIDGTIKHAEAFRVEEKEPYLQGGRIVDGFFKGVTDPLLTLKKDITKRLTVYLQKKEAAERERRRQEEAAAREAAEKAAREAAEAAATVATEGDLTVAIGKEDDARQASAEATAAAQAAAAAPAELSRTRSDGGTVASLRREWTFENLDRATLDLEALRPYIPTEGLEKAVRAYIRAGGRTLKGCNILETTSAAVR